MATGRSDYPNQINNVLCFPGFFRGLLDSRARGVNDEMKIAAAHAIASCVGRSELSPEYIIPSVFNKKVAPAVAREVVRAAHKTGVARRRRRRRIPHVVLGQVVSAPPARWSVVIPAFDESRRLPGRLRGVLEYFDGRGEPYEVLVVDDGSGDGTSERAAGGRRDPSRRRGSCTLPAHRGKGFAVREGMLRTRGALRLMADADGATPIAAVERLEAALGAGADVAVGGRARGPKRRRRRRAPPAASWSGRPSTWSPARPACAACGTRSAASSCSAGRSPRTSSRRSRPRASGSTWS